MPHRISDSHPGWQPHHRSLIEARQEDPAPVQAEPVALEPKEEAKTEEPKGESKDLFAKFREWLKENAKEKEEAKEDEAKPDDGTASTNDSDASRGQG